MSAFEPNEKRTLVGVGVIILAGGIAGILLGRGGAAPGSAQVVVVAAPSAAEQPTRAAQVPEAGPAVTAARPLVVALGDAELAKLAEESMAGPASLRVAAIEQLSKAPRDQALPLLKRVLLNGDPAVDRPAALLGLRTLALTQGDPDERIRDAVREVIYHGGDESFSTDAQTTLDAIAQSEAR